MSKFLKSLRFESEFDGDKVVMILTPLSRGDFLRILSEDSPDAIALLESFPQYVQSLDGLYDAAGGKIELADAFASAYFMPLMLAAAGFLIEKAVLQNPKKPGSRSATSQPGSPSPSQVEEPSAGSLVSDGGSSGSPATPADSQERKE